MNKSTTYQIRIGDWKLSIVSEEGSKEVYLDLIWHRKDHARHSATLTKKDFAKILKEIIK